MLYAERVEIILQQLQLRSTVKVTELSQLLHVSVDTVRRDLKAMEQEADQVYTWRSLSAGNHVSFFRFYRKRNY